MLIIALTGVFATTGTARAAGCIEWTGAAGDGLWSTAGNWDPVSVPGSNDDVCITQAGTYTVTVTALGESAKGLTLGGATGTQTLLIEGESANASGDWSNQTTLGIGPDGMTITSSGALVLDSTANSTPSPGGPVGASAALVMANGAPASISNAGSITAETSDPSWGELLAIGGTLANSGSLTDASGKLTLNDASGELRATNTGSITVASGATLVLDGGTLNNQGSFANNGTTTANGDLYGPSIWNQVSGEETGNTIQFTGSDDLDDTAGGGSFTYTNCGGGGGDLTGTIPQGQTVEVQGITQNCAGHVSQTSVLSLGTGSNPPAVVNRGMLILDAPGSGTTSGGGAALQGAELDNFGTLGSTVEDTSYANTLASTLVNEPGGAVNATGGKLNQTGATATTNNGTVAIGVGANWVVQGGSFTNGSGGTLIPVLASSSSFGTMTLNGSLAGPGTLNAGGTVAPSLASGFTPASGTEFPVIALDGGKFSGSFATLAPGFTLDTAHESTSPAYVGLVYGPAATTGPTGPTGSTAPVAPTVGKVAGGAGKLRVTVSCPAGAGACRRVTARATVTEKLKRRKVVAVAASAAKKKARSKVVVIASNHGQVAPGASARITLTLNHAGKALLKRFGRLKAKVTITAGGKVIKRTTVTITEPKKPKHKTK